MLKLNKVILAGNLGAEPDIRTMQSGDKVANLSVATAESWKDKSTGEWKEATEWHRVAVFNQASIGFIEKHLKKGDPVYIEGKLETRSYDKDGETRYTTEVVVRNYGGEIQLNRKFENAGNGSGQSSGRDDRQNDRGRGRDEMEDEIPFDRSRRDSGPAPRR